MQKRAFGLETEYSIAFRQRDGAIVSEQQPQKYLAQVIANAYRLALLSPLKIIAESRYDGRTSTTHNYWLGSNGARLYFDNQVLEYSTPECLGVKRAVIHSWAGDRVLDRIRTEYLQRSFSRYFDGIADIYISKGNTVFSQATMSGGKIFFTGSHENYSMIKPYASLPLMMQGRRTEFDPRFWSFIDYLSPFLASRVVLHGAGGIRFDHGYGWHYCVSQKAFAAAKDYSNVSTGDDRGIIKFQDKPGYCEDDHTRLQPVYADSNMAPLSTFLRLGTTHLVLRAWEEGRGEAPLLLAVPSVPALHTFARDPELKASVPVGGRRYTALDVQRAYLDMVVQLVKERTPEEEEILWRWNDALTRLAHDPESMSGELDWLIKLNYLRASNLPLDSPKARFADFLYSDVSERGIYNRLRKAGAVTSFIEDEERLVEAALATPESDSRSLLRSRFIKALLENPPRSWNISWASFQCCPRQADISKTVPVPSPLETENAALENIIEVLNIS